MYEEGDTNHTTLQTVGVHNGFVDDAILSDGTKVFNLNIATVITETVLEDFIRPKLREYELLYAKSSVKIEKINIYDWETYY